MNLKHNESFPLLVSQLSPLTLRCPVWVFRDGGLKRGKVKDSFKEQQQKQYSSMVVGDDSSSNSD